MKFVHIADMHFDIPFTTIDRKGWGQKRRLEQRETLKKIIEYIKTNNIEYLFIAGDLYEHEYIRQSTIEYINNLFKQISNTKIFISPGNHDPYLKNSYYNKFDWNDNVYIFTNEIGLYEESEVDIYGYGFNDFYLNNSKVNEIVIQNKEKINILITHASLDSGISENRAYNPIYTRDLNMLNFDYVALGHIHKNNYKKESKYIYPGSTISLGFDELGEHGMIVGEIENKQLSLNFVPLDPRKFKEQIIDITEIKTLDELIETINELEINKKYLYKIILEGDKNFVFNIYDLYKYIIEENIIKIKDNSKIKIDLEESSKANNLKGIFIKEMLQKLEQEPENREVIEKALSFGLEALEN